MKPDESFHAGLFRRLKPLYGKKIDALWFSYQIADPIERRRIEELLMVLAVKRLGLAVGDEKIVLEPPAPSVIGGGEYTLGAIAYPGAPASPFTLYRHELLRHVFILGPSGTGKSTFILGLLRQFLRDGLGFWSVDFKRNYRCLLNDTHGGNVLVVTVGRETAPLRLSMLNPPPGVGREEWVEALADIISASYLLLHGARNVLKAALLGARTLREARDLTASELVRARGGSRRYGWLESTHRTLDELSKLGDALSSPDPMPLDELLSRPVVFELQSLGDDQRKCFCLYLLQLMLLLRKHQGDEREVLRHVLVFDEAHNVFPKDPWGQLSVPSRLAREVREYGEALIAATQQADVADSLIANSGTKIILRTDHPKDVDFASKLLQVESRWLPKIPLGQGIARLPTRYYQAFLFSFPEQPLKNTLVADEIVRERYTQWQKTDDGLRAEIAGLLAHAQQRSSSVALNDRERVLLRDIAAHPISTVTERYERLGWNPKTGTTVRAALLKRGLVSFELVKTLRAQLKILTLTALGAAACGVSLSPRRHGGAAHEYWREQCKRWLKRHGYAVKAEHPVGGGKTADLLGKKADAVVIVEIETGKGDIPATVAKLSGLSGRRVLFVLDEETRQRLGEVPGIEVWTPQQLEE